MLSENIQKQNVSVAANAISLGVAVIQQMEGGFIGKVDEQSVAEVIAAEYHNELINRRAKDA